MLVLKVIGCPLSVCSTHDSPHSLGRAGCLSSHPEGGRLSAPQSEGAQQQRRNLDSRLRGHMAECVTVEHIVTRRRWITD